MDSHAVLLPAEPFEHWFNIHEYAPLIIFFAVYLGIVRNKKISHVARYHAMMVRKHPHARLVWSSLHGLMHPGTARGSISWLEPACKRCDGCGWAFGPEVQTLSVEQGHPAMSHAVDVCEHTRD